MRIERINLGFRRLTETLLRRRLWVLLGVGLCLGATVSGMGGLHTDVDPDNWLLEDDAMRQDLDYFEHIFGNSDYCAVLIEHENVFSPEVLRGIRTLGHELERGVPHADDVMSLTDLEFMLGRDEGLEITELVPDPVPESAETLAGIRALAMSRPSIRDRLVSADGTQTWVMLRLHGYGDKARSEGPDLQVGRSCTEIAAQPQYAFMHPRVSGMPVVNFEKKRFFNSEAPRLLGISLLVSALILAVALRSVWGVVFPLLTAATAMAMVLGVQGHLQTGIDPALIFLPLFLGMAVSIGYSIHVINHFRRHFLVNGGRHAAILHALEETGWPLLFTALTTAAAMLSFLLIPLQPIHWIGYTAASLVLVTWALVVLVLPVLLSFGRDRTPQPDAGPGGRSNGRPLERLLGAFGTWVLRRPRTVLALFVLLTLVCVAGLSQFRVSFDYRVTMGLQVPYIERLNHVANSQVGSLYSYDMAIAFDAPDKAREPANLAKLDQLREEILDFPLTKQVTTVNQVVKDLHQAVLGGDVADYRLPEDRPLLAQLLLLYENAGGTEASRWVDYDYQRLRMMIEIDDYDSEEAERELERIRARAAELFPDAEVYLIGSVAQYTYMMHQVTWGQLGSFMVALLIIGVLMMVVFGGVRIGLIAMIPNVAPALAVGGAMGWSGIPMDIMTVTIMPMLLGLAVDDSIHFIAHARLEHRRTGGDYAESIRRTFTSVGVALVLTSVVLVLNFSVYLASTVNMFIHMGALVALGIGAALLTDFFVTPVLLERLRPFDPRPRRG
ncbi:membrane protein [Marichromatium purpuratum 984]|uniref:Membrane protein n=1 Tax=Marichromatium purpuratum 984 TaxID=765910 RepID=W0DZQ2_MARPU|nr:membrane protein [Marichromatium purpuratum 984]